MNSSYYIINYKQNIIEQTYKTEFSFNARSKTPVTAKKKMTTSAKSYTIEVESFSRWVMGEMIWFYVFSNLFVRR